METRVNALKTAKDEFVEHEIEQEHLKCISVSVGSSVELASLLKTFIENDFATYFSTKSITIMYEEKCKNNRCNDDE